MPVDVPAAADVWAGSTCCAPAARSERMRNVVAGHVPPDQSIALLDLGCGTGGLLFRLAETLPAASLTGIDLSAANIRIAETRKRDHPAASRLTFTVADYWTYVAGPFDVIVADGVLHLLPGDTAALFGKLADDLAPAGVLICAMPFDCLYNRVFTVVRRGLRAIRSRATDEAILRVGRVLHGRDMDDRGLRERIPYMYMPPARTVDRALLDTVAPAVNLRVTARYPMPSTSVSQLRYDVTVFTRLR